jgi:hypothetical protein
MNGPIAQIAALTCHANFHLQMADAPPRFFPENSTTQYCEYVRFVEVKNAMTKPEEEEVALNPNDWFNYLAGAMGLRLWCDPGHNPPGMTDRLSAGLVGGGRIWTMEARYPKGSRFWCARWEVGDQNAADDRIWRVKYGRVASGPTRPLDPLAVNKIYPDLLAALKDIRAFSAAQEQGPFTDCFAHAIETLETGGRMRHGYHRDLAPEGALRPEDEAVLDACQSAWVFGAMGSWNDLSFEGANQQVYERLSDRAFDLCCNAIAAAATSSCKEN